MEAKGQSIAGNTQNCPYKTHTEPVRNPYGTRTEHVHNHSLPIQNPYVTYRDIVRPETEWKPKHPRTYRIELTHTARGHTQKCPYKTRTEPVQKHSLPVQNT